MCSPITLNVRIVSVLVASPLYFSGTSSAFCKSSTRSSWIPPSKVVVVLKPERMYLQRIVDVLLRLTLSLASAGLIGFVRVHRRRSPLLATSSGHGFLHMRRPRSHPFCEVVAERGTISSEWENTRGRFLNKGAGEETMATSRINDSLLLSPSVCSLSSWPVHLEPCCEGPVAVGNDCEDESWDIIAAESETERGTSSPFYLKIFWQWAALKE